jgi:hypothetical protein
VNEEPQGRRDTAAAGALLVATVLFCTGAGLGLGALLGPTAPLAILGGAVGLAAGFWLVYSRFRDI